MIDDDAMNGLFEEYIDLFGAGSIGFLAPSGGWVLNDKNLKRLVYYIPDWETEEGFRQKLAESKEKGRNMFYEYYKDYLEDPYPNLEKPSLEKEILY